MEIMFTMVFLLLSGYMGWYLIKRETIRPYIFPPDPYPCSREVREGILKGKYPHLCLKTYKKSDLKR